MRLSLAISPCPNDTFMFHALLNGITGVPGVEFDAEFMDIEELNRAALEGRFDVCKISYAMVRQVADRYAVIRSGSALGRGNGPVFVADSGQAMGGEAVWDGQAGSRQPIRRQQATGSRHAANNGQQTADKQATGNGQAADRQQIAGSGHSGGTPAGTGWPGGAVRVALPGEHTTANLLLSRFFPRLTDKTFVRFDAIAPAVAGGEFDAGVLIHEGRFTYQEHGLGLVADLGLLWERQTGLPLPLGAIVVRRGLGRETAVEIQRAIRQSIEYASGHPEVSREFVRRHAQESSDEVIKNHIELFVNKFSIDLGREGREAVERFVGMKQEEIFLA